MADTSTNDSSEFIDSSNLYYYGVFTTKLNEEFDSSHSPDSLGPAVAQTQSHKLKYSLQLIETDIKENDNNLLKLKDFLTKRLSKGSLDAKCKSIVSPIQLWDKDYCCYFANISTEERLTKVICFLAASEMKLELFQDDIDEFLYSIKKTSVYSSELANWTDICLHYVSRSLRALKNNVQCLIYAVCLDYNVKVVGADKKLCEDIERFVKSISVRNLFPNDENPTRIEKNNFEITFNEDDCRTNCHDSTKFCKQWANRMTIEDVISNPPLIKMILNNYKVKLSHDLNKLNRLLKAAQFDYYSLYSCLIFLRNSENASVLSYLVSGQNSTNEDVRKILDILQCYI